MALNSLGDLAQSFVLQRQNTVLKVEIQRLMDESISGRAADTAAHLSGDIQPLVGIDASLARLAGFRSATRDAGLFAGAMQTVLTTVGDMASDLSTQLLGASNTASTVRLNTVAGDARQKFETSVAMLNTRLGDRSLFAGQATSGAALTDGATMLAAIEAATAGATTPADIAAAVTAWFAAPTGYAAAYQGGAALVDLQLAPGERARLDITAREPALRDTLRGLAMATFIGSGALAGRPLAQAELAGLAGQSLLQSGAAQTGLSARLGTVEAQIEDASVRNAAERSSLEIARTAMVAVDPYETAARLEATQTQLEMLYALTARMTRLSLVDYL